MNANLSELACIFASILASAPVDAGTQDLECGQWSVIGPFGRLAADRDIETTFWPEKALVSSSRKAHDLDLEATGPGLEEHTVGWERLRTTDVDPTAFDVGVVDLRKQLWSLPGVIGWSKRAAVYLHRTLTVPSDLAVPVFVGALGGARVWLNGELLLEHVKDEHGVFYAHDRGVVLPLRSGVNHLFVKLVADDRGELLLRMQRCVRPPREAVSKAIDSAVEWLLSKQLPDGTWGGEEYDPHARTALVLHALAAAGLPSDHAAIRAACTSLAGVEDTHLTGAPRIARALVEHRGLRDHCPIGLLDRALHVVGRGFDRADRVPRYHVSFAAAYVTAMAIAHQTDALPLTEDFLEAVEGSQKYFGWVRPKGPKRRGEVVEAGFGPQVGFDIDACSTVAGLAVLDFLERHGGRAIARKQRQEIASQKEQCLAWLGAHARWDLVVGAKYPYQRHFSYLLLLEETYRRLAVSDLGGIDLRAAIEGLLLETQQKDGAWSYYYGESELDDTPAGILLLVRGQ